LSTSLSELLLTERYETKLCFQNDLWLEYLPLGVAALNLWCFYAFPFHYCSSCFIYVFCLVHLRLYATPQRSHWGQAQLL